MPALMRNNGIGPSTYQKLAWNGAAANYDMGVNGPAAICCRAIVVANATGPIVYVDASGNTITLPLAIVQAQPYFPIQAQSLVAAGSSAAIVLVLW